MPLYKVIEPWGLCNDAGKFLYNEGDIVDLPVEPYVPGKEKTSACSVSKKKKCPSCRWYGPRFTCLEPVFVLTGRSTCDNFDKWEPAVARRRDDNDDESSSSR